jgi:hypothetical protein
MHTPEDYIYSIQDANLRETALFLHSFILSYEGITCKLAYKIPFYYRNKWVCYINIHKKKSIELAFIRGNEMKNESGILDSRGRKLVLGFIFNSMNDINDLLLDEWMQDAIEVDERKK